MRLIVLASFEISTDGSDLVRIKYWGVRVTPSPLSLTTVGIGVIVEDPDTGTALFRFLENPSTFLGKFGFDSSIDRSLRNLQQTLDTYNSQSRSLELDHRFSASSLLTFLSDHWNNMFLVEGARYADMKTPEIAVETLYSHLIGFERSERQNKVTEVRRHVRDVYTSFPVVRDSIMESPELESDGMKENRIDLAVMSKGVVYEINRAFSFASKPSPEVLHRVESWTYKIHVLRESGGSLLKGGVTIAELRGDTPVVASIWPPESEAQKDLFAQATRKWKELNIDTLSRSDTESHAKRLELLIA